MSAEDEEYFMKAAAQASQEVMERMAKAGWISGIARGHGGLVVQWAELGKERTKYLRILLDELGKPQLTGLECSALLTIVDSLSPGLDPDQAGDTQMR